MALRTAYRWWVVLAVLVLTLACGDDGGDEGAAGAPAPPPELGHPCVRTCAQGICEGAGVFDGICTVECNSSVACTLGVTSTAALGCFVNRCALACANGEVCPMGTTCTAIGGGMACVPAG